MEVGGDPVNIGWVDIEGDLGIDNSPQREAAESVIDHLNNNGGIDGHPAKLITCVTKGTSGGGDCANQMVQENAVLVLDYSVIDTGTMYPILKSANIPVLGSGASPLNAADLTPDDNHFFTGAGALVRYATINPWIANTLQAKSVGVMVGSSSAAQQAAENFIKKPLEALGVEVKTITLAESNPDYTAAVNAISDTDVLQVLLACAGQDEAIKQAVALGYGGKIIGCTDPADLEAMGDAAVNVYGVSPLKPVADPQFAEDSDVKEFLAVADEYGFDAAVANEQVYSLVLAAKDIIETAGGATATGADVAAALKASANAPLALSSEAGLTCSTVLSPLAPTACNVDQMFVQVQDDGKTLKAVDGTFIGPPTS